MQIETYNPPALGKPGGMYSLVTRVRASEMLFVSGMVATDAEGAIVGADDFDQQCDCVYRRIGVALAAAGADFSNVVQFTTFLTDAADIPRFMEYRRREYPRLFADGKYPPNTLTVITALVRKELRIEIQTIAAI
jgi:enamine deaminase RidA (YjgF/YER057c/UK114 family)